MFYGQRIHDKCYRRPHFDAGQFVENWDDEGARKGYCLYKVGCKGPNHLTTPVPPCAGTAACPGQCNRAMAAMGCSEDGFWDKGSFYDRVTGIPQFGIEANADAMA